MSMSIEKEEKPGKILAHCQSEEDAKRLAAALFRPGYTVSVIEKQVTIQLERGEVAQSVVEATQKKTFSMGMRVAIMLEPPPPCKSCYHYECAQRRGPEKENIKPLDVK